MPTWNELLRDARLAQQRSQQDLARLAGVSAETISLYERAAVQPERPTLLRVTRMLRLPRRDTNAILTAGGFAPLPVGRLAQFETRRRTLDYLQGEVGAYAWPCLVTNNRMEIIAWNEPASRVAELDFARELPLPSQRNLFRIAAMPHFLQRLGNWDELVSVIIALLKGEGAELTDPDTGPPYFCDGGPRPRSRLSRHLPPHLSALAKGPRAS